VCQRYCGPLIVAKVIVEDGEDLVVPIPEMIKFTVYVLKPGA
jgi:hypothetical protein